jgi:hypothetical protein
MHPGVEHEPDDDGSKRWNHRAHRRTFLRCPGLLLRDGACTADDLHFWAEWEPEAGLDTSVADPVRGGPRYIFRPYYVPKAGYARYQNTDPFVFGDRFRYTGCQQNTKLGPTALRRLDRGSVVLFGSHLHGEFVLDTVFVVSDWVDHHARNWREVAVPEVPSQYVEVTLEPWYAAPKQKNTAASYRLYRGASPEDPVEGMFSYFPAAIAEETPHGFARPSLRLDGVITPSHKQGKRLNPQPDVASCAVLWKKVLAQVEAQGLAAGIRAAMPPRITEAVLGEPLEPPSEASC